MVPCTPYGCLLLLQDRLGDLSGLDAVVIGRSILVGKPMEALLLGANCTVTMAHSRTQDLADHFRPACIQSEHGCLWNEFVRLLTVLLLSFNLKIKKNFINNFI